jgi:hypothetical protein
VKCIQVFLDDSSASVRVRRSLREWRALEDSNPSCSLKACRRALTEVPIVDTLSPIGCQRRPRVILVSKPALSLLALAPDGVRNATAPPRPAPGFIAPYTGHRNHPVGHLSLNSMSQRGGALRKGRRLSPNVASRSRDATALSWLENPAKLSPVATVANAPFSQVSVARQSHEKSPSKHLILFINIWVCRTNLSHTEHDSL